MNAEYIESNLLNQLRLVTVGHIFPVWVHKTCIFVKAGELISHQLSYLILLCDELKLSQFRFNYVMNE